MSDFHRYQPRRSSAGSFPWRRWLLLAAVAVVIILIGKAVFGGKHDSTAKNTGNANATAAITLLNTNIANTNAADVNGNVNAAANVNAAINTGANFSVAKTCAKPLSQYGDKKQVALTFDLSAAGAATQQVIDLLKKNGTSASFFSTGTFAEKNKDLLAAIVKDGFSVYSRSYTSQTLSAMTPDQIATALTKADTAISTATGATSKPFLRPPAGDFNDGVIAAAKDAGYCLVTWTVDAFDWQANITADASKQRVLDKLRPGAIIALHAGYDLTPTVVDGLLKDLKTKGYALVSLVTLVGGV